MDGCGVLAEKPRWRHWWVDEKGLGYEWWNGVCKGRAGFSREQGRVEGKWA